MSAHTWDIKRRSKVEIPRLVRTLITTVQKPSDFDEAVCVKFICQRSMGAPTPQYRVTNGAPPPTPQSQSLSAFLAHLRLPPFPLPKAFETV